jgi:radical SAM superfamily enzyme YgiQ (UPF0313 family)
MRLLLTHGYFLDEDVKERDIMKPYAPMGILYLSSHLRRQGFDVDVYDSTFGSKQELFGILERGPRGVVGIYGNLMTRRNVLEIAARARQYGWKVILGGPEPANYPEDYLAGRVSVTGCGIPHPQSSQTSDFAACGISLPVTETLSGAADVIVSGEGELALEELLRSRMEPSFFPRIGGLIYRAPDGSIVHNPRGPLIEDLDSQPWPDRERIRIESYLEVWRTRHGQGSVSLITARGCPYSCNWCSHAVYGKTHRRRSPVNVVKEVEWILGRYHPEMMWLADDVFTIHHGWLFEYAAEMRRRGLRIPFECITRADRVNQRVADTLAELGCFRVWIGSESGSQRILDAMQRGVKVEQVQSAVAALKASGIQTGMFLMWGYEGEEIEDIEATVEHVKRCRPDVCFTTVSYPIKGTPYYDRVAAKLVTIGGFSETTDRDLRIRGRHSRRFYKHADELLRSQLNEPPDGERMAAARAAMRETWSEVEA